MGYGIRARLRARHSCGPWKPVHGRCKSAFGFRRVAFVGHGVLGKAASQPTGGICYRATVILTSSKKQISKNAKKEFKRVSNVSCMLRCEPKCRHRRYSSPTRGVPRRRLLAVPVWGHSFASSRRLLPAKAVILVSGWFLGA